MRTAQQIFDTVANHLLTQKSKSMIGTRCAYRGFGDKKCAIGILIPDEQYASDMEGKNIRGIVSLFDIPLKEELKVYLQLLVDLQFVHDQREVEEWEYELRLVAQRYFLNYTQ